MPDNDSRPTAATVSLGVRAVEGYRAPTEAEWTAIQNAVERIGLQLRSSSRAVHEAATSAYGSNG